MLRQFTPLTFGATILFSVLVGFSIGNGWTTQDALQGQQHALVHLCSVKMTKAVGKAVTVERHKKTRFVFLPF